MKALKALVLAWLGWAWSFVVAGWAKAKVVGKWSYDPPPHQIKYWALLVVGIMTAGMFFGGTIVSWFDRSVLGPLHTAMYPVAQPSIERLIPDAVFPSDVPSKWDTLKAAPKKEWPDLEALKPVAAPPAAVPTKDVVSETRLRHDAAVPAAPTKKAYVAKAKKRPAAPSVYGSAY